MYTGYSFALLRIIPFFSKNTTYKRSVKLFLGGTLYSVNCQPSGVIRLTKKSKKKADTWCFARGSMSVIESDWQVKHTFTFITRCC